MNLILSLLLMTHAGWASPAAPVERKFIVITDLEPDDRLALMLLAAHVRPSQLLLVGTALFDSGRKAALTERLLRQLGFAQTKVVAGTAGEALDYPDVRSTRTARAYADEGRGVLPPAELARLSAPARGGRRLGRPRYGPLATAIVEALRPHRFTGGVEIVVLAPPTDFIVAMNGMDMAPAISKIHVMGGWTSDDEGDFSGYNWTMDPYAASKLLEMSRYGHVPTILYPAQLIKEVFGGGTINSADPAGAALIARLKAGTHPAFHDFFVAARSWNAHVVRTNPRLAPVVKPFAHEQFTPADPLVIAGLFDPAVIVARRPVAAEFKDVERPDPKHGFPMRVSGSNESSLYVVERIDRDRFYDFANDAVDRLSCAAKLSEI